MEPDDPSRPIHRKPPPIPQQQDPEFGAIERILAKYQKAIIGVEQGFKLTNALKEFLLYAFIAETGHRPSECCLIQKVVNGPNGQESRFWFQHTSESPHSLSHALHNKDLIIEALKLEIQVLNAKRTGSP